MNRRIAGVAAVAAALLLPAAAFASQHFFFNGFETDTSGWNDLPPGTVNREPSGYSNAGGYADGTASAAGDWHARLRTTQAGGCAPPFSQATSCSGPFTDWGDGFDADTFPSGGYVTEVAVYLDTAWASDHPDWRFDWSSAINNTDGTHLSDFVFNAGTNPIGDGSWVVNASTNAFRHSTFPSNLCPSPSLPPNSCRLPATIATSGWYTFRHTFRDHEGTLAVDMQILDAGGAAVASWTIYSSPIAEVGGNRYGWFANQEIHDLPLDNTLRRNRTPQTVDECKNGGWQNFDNPSFMNQGDCIQFVLTGR